MKNHRGRYYKHAVKTNASSYLSRATKIAAAKARTRDFITLLKNSDVPYSWVSVEYNGDFEMELYYENVSMLEELADAIDGMEITDVEDGAGIDVKLVRGMLPEELPESIGKLHTAPAAASYITAVRTFNMQWINDTIDDVMEELSEQAKHAPEIQSALIAMNSAKELVHAYGMRLGNTSYQSV